MPITFRENFQRLLYISVHIQSEKEIRGKNKKLGQMCRAQKPMHPTECILHNGAFSMEGSDE